MKIENLALARSKERALKAINKAIVDAEEFLRDHKKDVFGDSTSGDGLYSFSLCKYTDGSGPVVNLTDCAIGLKVVEFALEELKRQKAKVISEIEAL
jgi:hypothetical protein